METVKQEIEPVFNLFRTNEISLTGVLNSSRCQDLDTSMDSSQSLNSNDQASNDVAYDSDCEMIGDSVPTPLASTKEELTKQENDPISNNIPFTATVS